MTDDQLEDLLKRLRPAGPSAELRARILAPRRPEHAGRWVAAAAALLAVIVGLQAASDGVRESMRAPLAGSQLDESGLADMQQMFELTDVEVRALAMEQEFVRTKAPDGDAERNLQ